METFFSLKQELEKITQEYAERKFNEEKEKERLYKEKILIKGKSWANNVIESLPKHMREYAIDGKNSINIDFLDKWEASEIAVNEVANWAKSMGFSYTVIHDTRNVDNYKYTLCIRWCAADEVYPVFQILS